MLTRRRFLHFAGRTGFGAGLLLFAAPAYADPATDAARRAIQAAYDRANAAIARKDIAAYQRDQTADFASVDIKGSRRDRRQERDELIQLFPAMQSAKGSTTITKITLGKGGKTATVVTQETGTIVLRNPQTHQNATVVSTGTSEDIWVLVNNRWLWKHSHALSGKSTIDGKPVNN